MVSPGRPGERREVEREFWLSIAEGKSTEEAASLCGMSVAPGTRLFRQGGGMPTISLTPPSGRYLSFPEREEIALLRASGAGIREIAKKLERAPSTISRELRRNVATRNGKLEYRPSVAHWKAEFFAHRPKTAKLAENRRLREYVEERLAGKITLADGSPAAGPTVPFTGRKHGPRKNRRWGKAWSPEQISNRLKVDFPDDESMRISHEAIYQSLYVQGRGALRRELVT